MWLTIPTMVDEFALYQTPRTCITMDDICVELRIMAVMVHASDAMGKIVDA